MSIKKISASLSKIIIGSFLPLSLFIVWYLASTHAWIDPRIWSSPERFSNSWNLLVSDHFLFKAVIGSLWRDILGASLGIGTGLFVGIILGLFRTAEWLGAPLFNFLKNVAIFAWIPLIIMVFGLGELSKIVFIALGTFYPVAQNVFDGLRNTDPKYLELSKVYQLSIWQQLCKIVFPSALPSVITGIQIALIAAWVSTVGAEFFMTAGYSIGGLLIQGTQSLKLELVFIGAAFLAGIGLSIHQISQAVGNYLLRNRPLNLASEEHS